MSITQESAKQILQSRVVIPAAGKYTVKVTHVTRGYINSSGRVVDIVNFGAMTGYQASEAVKNYKAGDYDAAVATSLSTSQLENQYTPVNGEIVDVEIGEHFSEKVGETILVVNAIVARQAVKASRFSLADLDGDLEPEAATAVEEEEIM